MPAEAARGSSRSRPSRPVPCSQGFLGRMESTPVPGFRSRRSPCPWSPRRRVELGAHPVLGRSRPPSRQRIEATLQLRRRRQVRGSSVVEAGGGNPSHQSRSEKSPPRRSSLGAEPVGNAKAHMRLPTNSSRRCRFDLLAYTCDIDGATTACVRPKRETSVAPAEKAAARISAAVPIHGIRPTRTKTTPPRATVLTGVFS